MMAGMGVKFSRLIKANAPGKCPFLAPAKKIRDELNKLQCKAPKAESATKIWTIHVKEP